MLISGKNDCYFPDDEEAYVAEVNARRKGHPNYFTDVANMLNQVGSRCEVMHERYALRRGDFGKGIFAEAIPERFYEWIIILKKNGGSRASFEKFSDGFSKTWKMKNGKTMA